MATTIHVLMGEGLLGENLLGGDITTVDTITITPTTGSEVLYVDFKYNGDETYITSYLWYFGDGFTSSERRPSHTYQMSGVYETALKITFVDGSTEMVSGDNVVVTDSEDDSYLSFLDTHNKSYRFGLDYSEGLGISENSGDDWVRPEAQTGVCKIIDEKGFQKTIVYDYRDGKFWDITNREGATNSGLVDIWTDKSSDASDNGTDIEQQIWFKEDRGTYEHFFLENNENHLYFRPIDSFPDNTLVDYYTYADDDKINHKSLVNDLKPPTFDFCFDKRFDANRIQQLLRVNKAKIRLVGRHTYYKVSDRASRLSNRLTEESTYQDILASNMILWFSRGTDLYDRINGVQYNVDYTNVNGPDDKGDSGFNLSTDLQLSNISTSDGYIILWTTEASNFLDDFSALNGIHMTIGGNYDGWTAVYYGGSIPANITLPHNYDIFDFRIYDTNIDETTITYYEEDVTTFNGVNTCPMY